MTLRVVTTTTTTTTYAPIQLPPIPPPSSPKDPKLYPLLNATLPRSLREFPLVFPGGSRATFHDGELGEQEMQEEESVVEGKGWKMVKRDESDPRKEVGLAEAIERYGRKRSYSNENMMEGIEAIPGLITNTPPRKKAKSHPPPINTINTMNTAAPPSPLPSPHCPVLRFQTRTVPSIDPEQARLRWISRTTLYTVDSSISSWHRMT